MKNSQARTHLSVVGKLPEGYIILCEFDGEEYSFLAKALNRSKESNFEHRSSQ
jgi:hypothetical protein